LFSPRFLEKPVPRGKGGRGPRLLSYWEREFMGALASNDLTTPRQRLYANLDMLFLDHAVLRFVWTSRVEVAPGLYRSNQPMPFQLAREARRGTRTIINLRGARVCGSYALEAEACRRHGLTLIDFPVNSRDVPKRETLLAARDLFARIEYPALMHCKSGADRAGLMSVLYLVMQKGEPVSKALRHLSWRFGHVRQAKTGILDFFFERYLDYAKTHPVDFTTWALTVYDPAEVKSHFMSQWWANLVVDKLLRRE
jgi:protein tyrosine/serine phosphatase